MSCRLCWFAAAIAIVSGCADCHWPKIDPSGEHIFAPSSTAPAATTPISTAPVSNVSQTTPVPGDYRNSPGELTNEDDVLVTLSPETDKAALVGTEVILVAGVGGADGLLKAHRRLEWTIASGGVGQFTDIGKTGCLDRLLGDDNPHQIVNSTYAVGSTGHIYDRLTRGTPDPNDDIYVTAGQGWVSMTSPVEGDSVVTVVSPQVYNWNARHKSVTIHWLDVNWRFPPPAINPAGTEHTFTTTVTKHTSQSPCPGYIVRYTIVGGPPAGFLPDGAKTADVPTNAAGQASVVIRETTPAHGTNQVKIEIIRPGTFPGASGKNIIIGRGSTMKTWTAAKLAIRNVGPSSGAVGSTLAYRIEISNAGDLPAKDVQLSNPVPDGVAYVSSNPPAEAAGQVLRWRLGDMAAGQCRAIDVHFRAVKEGSVVNCVDVIAAGGIKASECATTTITNAMPAPAAGTAGDLGRGTDARPDSGAGTGGGTVHPPTSSQIDVQITGPQQAAVGSEAEFLVTVSNRGMSPTEKLMLVDFHDVGLQLPKSDPKKPDQIDAPIDPLPANSDRKIQLIFKVLQPGQLKHRVEVRGPDGKILARSNVSTLTATGQGTPPGQKYGETPGAGAQNPPPTGAQNELLVKVIGPQSRKVGELAPFQIEVANVGNRPLTNLKVEATCDVALKATEATDGFLPSAGVLIFNQPKLPIYDPKKKNSLPLEIRYQCLKAASGAVVRVRVTSAEGATGVGEASIEIVAASRPPFDIPGGAPAVESKMQFDLTPLKNPVRAGGKFTYLITVANRSTADERNVVLDVTVPDGMTIERIGTNGPTTSHIEGQNVKFDPLPTLSPDKPQAYRIYVQTKTAGNYSLKASLSTENLSTPINKDCPTEVIQ